MLNNLFSVLLLLLLLLLLLNSEFCQGPVHYKPTLIKNTSFSGSQLSRLLEVMDARKNRACEEDSRISVGRPFFFAYYVQAPAPLVIFPATDSGFVQVMENLEGH